MGMSTGAVAGVKLPTTAFSLTAHLYVLPFFWASKYLPGTKIARDS